MNTAVKISLTCGSIYEVCGDGGKQVEFRFIGASSGKLLIEINGTQTEVESICNLVQPEQFYSLILLES
jgi:hypothetical protein